MALFGRRLLVPDENLPWSTFATPVAIRIARREGIDVVITTSPPPSLHLLGAAVKKASGAAWVADLRDPLTSNPHRRGDESQLARLKEKTVGGIGRLVASQADAIIAASEGLARVGTQAALFGRRLLVPDENLPWSAIATPVAIRLARREGIDVVITTSPPPSLHLLGAAVKRASGAAWVADLRDPLTSHPHRRGY